jgi:membrane protein DedA with SNARE-associated domain
VVNLLATLPKSALLFSFGYFASAYLPLFERHAALATIVLGAVGVAAVALILWRADGLRAGGAGR